MCFRYRQIKRALSKKLSVCVPEQIGECLICIDNAPFFVDSNTFKCGFGEASEAFFGFLQSLFRASVLGNVA